MQKNVDGQKVLVYAYNKLTGDFAIPDTGTFTSKVCPNAAGLFVTADGDFLSLGYGYYSYSPTQDETDCDLFLLRVVSSEENIEVDDVIIYTREVVVDHTFTLQTLLLKLSSLSDSDIVDGKSLTEAVQIIAAIISGKVSGAGTGTEVFLGLDGTTTRATVSVDKDGNRTNVTYV